MAISVCSLIGQYVALMHTDISQLQYLEHLQIGSTVFDGFEWNVFMSAEWTVIKFLFGWKDRAWSKERPLLKYREWGQNKLFFQIFFVSEHDKNNLVLSCKDQNFVLSFFCLPLSPGVARASCTWSCHGPRRTSTSWARTAALSTACLRSSISTPAASCPSKVLNICPCSTL